MQKRSMLSFAMLASGAAMLVAASAASPGSTARRGGIFKFTMFFGIENIDPQRSYYVPEWQYEWLTGRMLLNFAHAPGARGYRLLNDGARSYTISRNGKTYTFHLRRGMKFSNGAPLNAKNYEHALLRLLNPNVDSRFASLLIDPDAVEIVGALDYHAGRTSTVSGIKVVGNYTLRIGLARPSASLPTLLALPPTAAAPIPLPLWPITSAPCCGFALLEGLPSGGRYYIQEYVPDRSIKIRKNRFYKPLGAAPTPGVASGFDYEIGVPQDQALLLIKRGEVDWASDGLPPSAWDPIFAEFGTKGRARVFPTSIVDYITLNNSKGPFANVNVRKSIAWGINRLQIAAFLGGQARTPQCSLLTPAIPGYKKCTLYPPWGNLAKARSLANGHTDDLINFWYISSTLQLGLHQVVTGQLDEIGFDNIHHVPFSSGLFSALGRRGNSYDVAVVGWAADFPDPYDYVNKLLSGETIREIENTNTAYFNNPEANRLMRAAAQLTGQKRLTAYGNLDLMIQRRWAPIAVIDRRNDREFFSPRVVTKSVVQSPIYEIDLGKLALR